MNRKCEAFLAEYGLAEKQIFIFYSYLNSYFTPLTHANILSYGNNMLNTHIRETARRDDEGVSRKSTDTNEQQSKAKKK